MRFAWHNLTLVPPLEKGLVRLLRRSRKRRIRFAALYLCVAIFVLIVLPWTLYSLFGKQEEIHIEGDTIRVQLLCHQNNEIIELGLEEYIVGVVAAEMPAAFPPEALKAQAIAARTYAVKRLQAPDPRIKEISLQADLSTDPAINQAWIDNNEMKKRWGLTFYNTYRKKIADAVLETRGRILLYGGQLIDPVYHASCGGIGTENSGEVWKYDIPYLKAVPCSGHPEGNKEATVVFKISELDRLLGTQLSALPAAKRIGNSSLKINEKTASGRVKSVLFAGKTISGTDLRSKLGLRSTWFSWQLEKREVKFTTIGYGHGVGMCQYGAKALALAGKKCEEILLHYYTGVTVGRLE